MQRNILVLGGNSGIGLASVKKLEEEGHIVTAAVRNPGPLTELGVETQHFDAENHEINLSLPDVLDGVLYCPGTIDLKPFHRISPAEFQKDLEINFLGAVRALQAALPALKKSKSASVVLFSTVAVELGMPFHTSIAAAKGALEGMGRALAAELAPAIRVNMIAPSLTVTGLAENLLKTEAQREAAAKRHPLNRVGSPDEIASLVSFLMSDASQFITGQTFRPDGGLSSVKLFS